MLIQSWFPNGYFSFNSVGWFVSTIFFLYLIENPLIAIAKKIDNKKSIMNFIIIIISIFGLSALYCYLLRCYDFSFWLSIFPLSRIFEYISGICLGYVVRGLKDKIIVHENVIFTVLELFASLFWIFWVYLSYVTYSNSFEWIYFIVFWLPSNLFLLFIFSFGKGYLSKVLRLYSLKRLGTISFECFLIHQIIIRIYSTMSWCGNTSLYGNIFSVIFCMFLTLIISIGISKTDHKVGT